MTLTVRLPTPLERSLDAYCAANGLTKSHVVQECLTSYLGQARTRQSTAAPEAAISAAYAAFRRAGLIGCVNQTSAGATRDVVRQRALQRLQRGGA